jgi:hypothetical protein
VGREFRGTDESLSPIQASRNILTGQRENRAIIVPATVKPIRMPLTITVARYQAIRRRVHEATLKRLLADPVPGAGDRSFQSVDECMNFLDALADQEVRSPRLPKEGR